MTFYVRTITAMVAALMTTQVLANTVINDYQFIGLNRTTSDSLAHLLPARGQMMTDEMLADSIRALYATDQFSNVQAVTQNGVLVYTVSERPLIAEVNFKGNKLIPKQGLEQGLKQAGLGVGQVLKQADVHQVQNELANQYLMQGYYNSDIKVVQTPLAGNRVKLDIEFVEGSAARVVDIQIKGNTAFSDSDIKRALLIKERVINPFSRANRYSQQAFDESLKALQALYLNAGYADFAITHAAINVNEDKDSVFVEIGVDEGEKYRFGSTHFVGQSLYLDDELKQLIAYEPNAQYAQDLLNQTHQNIINKFGDEGYYNAQIRPITKIDKTTGVVDIEYHINLARPVYVRRINFSGNIKTKDEVLRREMRQLEGALASKRQIELSRIRLMRTGYFKDVAIQTRPVVGLPDQMDINVIVEEQPSGSLTLAAGYSQNGGVTFQAEMSQNNFMGTGNRVNASFSRSATQDNYNLGYVDPYFTVDGVSQGLGAYYRKTKYDSKNISNYILDSFGGNLTYGYPIDENQRISGGLTADNTKVRGGSYLGLSNAKELLDDGGRADFVGSASFENQYKTYNALLGWNYTSLDKPIFPTQGMNHGVDLKIGFGDKNYQKAVYRGNIYRPFIGGSTLRGYANLGYGNNLPFYENFYAGGYGSVRGYEASSLGPRSPAFAVAAKNANYERLSGEIVGGNALATFGAELILPLPFKGDWTDNVRPTIFVEGGQVFDTTNKDSQIVNMSELTGSGVSVANPLVKRLTQDKELRYSAGVGATWNTPIGPVSISYAKPINAKPNDRTENVQFQIGSVF